MRVEEEKEMEETTWKLLEEQARRTGPEPGL